MRERERRRIGRKKSAALLVPLTGHDIYVLLVSFHPAAAMSRAQDTQEIDTHTHTRILSIKQRSKRPPGYF